MQRERLAVGSPTARPMSRARPRSSSAASSRPLTAWTYPRTYSPPLRGAAAPTRLGDLDGLARPLERGREVLDPLQRRGDLDQGTRFLRPVLDAPGQLDEHLRFGPRPLKVADPEEQVGARPMDGHERRDRHPLAQPAGGLERLAVEVERLAQPERLRSPSRPP